MTYQDDVMWMDGVPELQPPDADTERNPQWADFSDDREWLGRMGTCPFVVRSELCGA